jgi:hypothetical protein
LERLHADSPLEALASDTATEFVHVARRALRFERFERALLVRAFATVPVIRGARYLRDRMNTAQTELPASRE